ncbi:unnamed protein product, partial [Musa acuminata subsp. burmannicoides]
PEQGVQATSTSFGIVHIDVEHPKAAPRNTRWRRTAPTRTTSDIPGPFRKTRDGVAQRHLQGTSHPLEESAVIKGPRTTNRPVASIKSQPSYRKGRGKRH